MKTTTRIISITGGVITLGFGLWHYVVPTIFVWFSYMPSIPEELKNGITATNFFLSTTLTLMGTQTIILSLIKNKDLKYYKIHLLLMSILWLSRVGYQIIKPQGIMVPGLPLILTCIFCFTALCFIIPLAITAMRKKD